jgi:ribosomal protein S12 methylthiotransferase
MKIGLISLGCPKNLVDSEVMLGLAQRAGHELTQDPATAEALVINTCAFIDSAKEESIDAILEMARHKKDGSCRRLIVTGCLAERYRDELLTEIPEIDVVLGTGEVPGIVSALDDPSSQQSAPAPLHFFRSRRSAPTTAEMPQPGDTAAAPRASVRRAHPLEAPDSSRPRPTYLYDADTPRVLATPSHYAYVKVAEGCDYKCAFCIIPTLRGPYRSRSAASIVQEARTLAARGTKELMLISQDTTFYGVDHGRRGALAALMRELNTIDGLEWIRLLYLYPTTIDAETLEAMADCQKICKYVDLPLQHASDPVLTRMKRPGTRRTYDALLSRIRMTVPDVALRTTFIVGFPGETETDVDALCEFVSHHEFEHVGVFSYSHEEGTSAFRLPDDVPVPVKTARLNRVMALQKRLVGRRQKARIGQRARVIVDGPSSEHDLVLRARLSSQAPDIDASVYLTECDPSQYRAGDFVEVEIVGARDYDLVARPLRTPVL